MTEMSTGRALGITPAPAGRRNRLYRIQQFSQDHPRACGEKGGKLGLRLGLGGSPPRLRGEVRWLFQLVKQ